MAQRRLMACAPATVYIFGSAAKGMSRQDSDIDLAFIPRANIPPYDVFMAAQRLAEELGREVDLVDLSCSSAVMRAQVVETGRVILDEDPLKRERFEMYALADYARLNEERRPVLETMGALR